MAEVVFGYLGTIVKSLKKRGWFLGAYGQYLRVGKRRSGFWLPRTNFFLGNGGCGFQVPNDKFLRLK